MPSSLRKIISVCIASIACTLVMASAANAQVSIGAIMDNAISTIGTTLSNNLAQAQADAPNLNLFPACPAGQGTAAMQDYLARTPGLDAAIAAGDTAGANNLIARAIAACPNGAATITQGIVNQ